MGWRQEVDRSDKYFELLMNRMSEKFYAENYRRFRKNTTRKI